MAAVKVRFEVFVKGPERYEMSGYMLGYSAAVRHRRLTRKSEPKPFRLPSFMYAGEGDFRQPRPFADAAARRAIERAAACYVVEYEGERADSLWYLDAAINLAEDIAKQCKGVIVNRTADLFFSKAAFARLKKGVSPRDTVSLRETERGDTITLATEGMSKYGQQEFVLTAFPLDLREAARRLLYDNLCSYSMNRAVLAGQTFGGGTVRMIFVNDARGRLEIRDVHPEEKKALEGTANLAGALRPLWAVQTAAETPPRRPKPSKKKTPRTIKKPVAAKRTKRTAKR